ncbi:MAG TPA: ROK family protein [Longimicrobiaceae bacterium]|nr:ROK family protein [Longimicrobiaceae bacterium]
MRKIDPGNFTLATRSTAREINRQILLNLVRELQPVSRADLARRMEMGPGMVTSLVNELLGEELLLEGESVEAPRGRKPKMLYVRTHDRLVIAIDLRLSVTQIELCDLAGRTIALEAFATSLEPARLVEEMALRSARLLETHGGGGRCQGIGLVIPGMVDRVAGRVLNAPQLGWRNVSMRDELASATGMRVEIENGPIACALAKMWLARRGGAPEGDFAYLSVFDGVGAGLVVGGQIVRGAGHTAGEFGHVPTDPRGTRCLCGARGCLEAHTSNLATLSRYLGLDLSAPGTRERLTEEGLSVPDLINRARSGDSRARAAIEETGRHLALGLVNLIHALNPARVFVGGEIVGAWEVIDPLVRAELRARALTEMELATPILPDQSLGNPRLRGAAALVAAPLFAAPSFA